MKNYYQILGVSKKANESTIKDAYRRNALRYHPDKNTSPEASAKFQLISEAYSILGDPYKRGRYDYEFENQNNFSNPFNFSMNNAVNLFDSFFSDSFNDAFFNTPPKSIFRQHSFSQPPNLSNSNNRETNRNGSFYSYSSQSTVIDKNGQKQVQETYMVNKNGNKNRYQTQYEIDSFGNKKNIKESGNRNLLGTGQGYKNANSNKYLR